jgi:hypothetical protein
MFSAQSATVYHSNRYTADSACEHCGGVIRHENWCITRDPLVFYAYEVVLHPAKLTPEDALRLHGLGVLWSGCQGTGARPA